MELAQRHWQRSFQGFWEIRWYSQEHGEENLKVMGCLTPSNQYFDSVGPAVSHCCWRLFFHWLIFYRNRANGWKLQFRVCADWMMVVMIRLKVKVGSDGGAFWRCIARRCVQVMSDKSYLWVGCTWMLKVESVKLKILFNLRVSKLRRNMAE